MTEDVLQQRVNAFLGTLFFLLAAVLSALIFLDRWTSIDVAFPGIWYRSRNLHVVLCAGLYLAGWWAHRNSQSNAQYQNETGSLFHTLSVYTKPNCELCDRALDVLQIYSESLPPVKLVDISGNSELEAQHAETIPVVEIDGQIRFRGIVNAELLERLINARRHQIQSRLAKPDDNSDQTYEEPVS